MLEKPEKPRILAFIPMYNCETQISRVICQFTGEIAQYIEEVIIVNNISTDASESKAIDYLKSTTVPIAFKVLRNHENYGLGGSHKVAFNFALDNGFDYIVVLHGDDQGSIKEILPVLSDKSYMNYDCCLGARFMKGSSLPGYSAFRTFGNQVYNLLFSMVCGRRVYDLGSGLNMYHTSMLKNKFYLKYPDNLTFNYCMVMGLQYYRQTSLFFPISWREDDQISNVKLFSQAKRVLGMLASYFFGRERFMKQELRESPKEEYTAEIIFDSREA